MSVPKEVMERSLSRVDEVFDEPGAPDWVLDAVERAVTEATRSLTQQVERLETEAERKILTLIELERHTRRLGFHALADKTLAALSGEEKR